MEVIVAKTAGFCFGVRRAVNQVYEQVEKGRKPIYTYGPIIHNEEVVRDLEERGVVVIHDEEELSKITDGTVIIRSHGVSKNIYGMIEAQGLQLVDATCPFVKKIHKIVERKSAEGADIVIIGNANHPEVQGIRGWASGLVTVFETQEEALEFVRSKEAAAGGEKQPGRVAGSAKNSEMPPQAFRESKNSLCIVSQTTFNYKKFDKLVEIISKMSYDREDILNTICNATEERQTEAREIARQADAMIVIGGKHSSNTQKLFEICRKECANTYYIQTLVDLDIRLLPSRGCVGITAGASTPNNLIEEVSKQCLS